MSEFNNADTIEPISKLPFGRTGLDKVGLSQSKADLSSKIP